MKGKLLKSIRRKYDIRLSKGYSEMYCPKDTEKMCCDVHVVGVRRLTGQFVVLQRDRDIRRFATHISFLVNVLVGIRCILINRFL